MTRLLLAAVSAVVVATAGTAWSASDAATTTPKWVTIPWLTNLDNSPRVFGAASGRAWIGLERADGRIAFATIHAVGGRVAVTRGPLLRTDGADMRIVGSQLLFHPPDIGSDVRSVPLLANGMLGTPRVLSPDPEQAVAGNLQAKVLAGFELSDRTVWFMTGGTGFGKQYSWACCSRDGSLRDLTPLMNQKAGTYFVHFGLDAAGRLWLSWVDVGSRSGRPVRLVELDPATLAPRVSAALTVPGIRTATGYDFVCAAACRVVASRVEGDIVSWAPGERSPNRIVGGTRTRPATLLGAAFRSGGLTVGYAAKLPGTARKEGDIAIRVIRGDARGSRPRRVGAAVIPATLSPMDADHVAMNQANYGAFTPDGLAFLSTYLGEGTRFVAGLIPVTR